VRRFLVFIILLLVYIYKSLFFWSPGQNKDLIEREQEGEHSKKKCGTTNMILLFM
ncbi:hypothetical protein ACJX0J_027931, partial [Zea mays]